MLYKLFVIIIIFAGEALAIYAEMVGARQFSDKVFVQLFLKMFLIMTSGGIFLVAGYMIGYKHFQNIWIVSAISVTSILIIEPFLAYSLFHQLPSRGALLGFIFGSVGFAVTLLWN